MKGPDPRNGRDTQPTTDDDSELIVKSQADASEQLVAMGGELLEGSGFEEEEPEKDFL